MTAIKLLCGIRDISVYSEDQVDERKFTLAMKTQTYDLTLRKTYYDKGFFNLGVEVDHLILSRSCAMRLLLGDAKEAIDARMSREANINGTPRVLGGAKLRNWFWKYSELHDHILVEIIGPTELWLKAASKHQTERIIKHLNTTVLDAKTKKTPLDTKLLERINEGMTIAPR